jgi:stress response protein YsnF
MLRRTSGLKERSLTLLVVEDEVVLVRRLILKKELHIRRRVETETVEVPVTLRRQRAEVERTAPSHTNEDEEIRS